ncbi:hypothetical protein JYG23_07940 [Sedimentibacter sp. zth1]|uniref:DUF5694 domain-containing protein n=1 Tax=Sedimentibacter sp. zth1 TaxID=2816908 RepID=UPI001A913C0F|nr:DUF5694 domain-containing protein [Sedimentibacter sp. zth1]QSX04638.1 hypothetical protein JYG23_07940 [Sedimentibacter sp. zth1]
MSKSKIMILGTFHMASFKDLFNTNVVDLASDKRQKEIIQLVDKIKKFSPTKIAVEIEYKYSDKINESYSNYVNGKAELKMSETQQIAFRLAKALEHDKIYAVDWMERGASINSISDVYDFTKKEQPQYLKLFSSDNCSYGKDITITEILRSFNDKESIKNTHEQYVNMARIGLNNDYVGMGWLTWWYQRNLIIFARLAQLVENKNERIFLLIGAGHTGMLSNFLEESGLFDVVNTLNYL